MSTLNVTYDLAGALTAFMQATEFPADQTGAAVLGDTAEVKALVSAAQAGDQSAFGTLVAMHERAVVRTAMAALGSKEDAEDAAQDAFVTAWRKLDGFRGASSFKTWLLTITWRKALDRRRARHAWWSRQSAPPTWAEDQPFEHIPADDASPERLTVSRDLVERARAEIAKLSPKLRDVLLLAVTGEHRYEDIASLLGVPTGTVKWRMNEARRQLAERLER